MSLIELDDALALLCRDCCERDTCNDKTRCAEYADMKRLPKADAKKAGKKRGNEAE